MAAADHYFLAGEIERSHALLEDLAARLDEGPPRARALRRLARTLAFEVGYPVTAQLLSRALADSGTHAPTRALLAHDLRKTVTQYGHLRQAATHADNAIRLANE